MIEPSVGRIVWYRELADKAVQPQAAIVCFVHGERMVNLVVFNAAGYPVAKTNVVLLQDDDEAPWHGNYAEWMPYQKGQAAKTEAPEARVNTVEAREQMMEAKGFAPQSMPVGAAPDPTDANAPANVDAPSAAAVDEVS